MIDYPDIKTTPRMPVRASEGIPQYSGRRILGIWLAAAIPMALLSWLVAPRLAGLIGGDAALGQSLIITLTAGLAWQFLLVAVLVIREQGTWQWSVLRRALWLQSPTSPRTGRTGGRLWLLVIPLTILFGCKEFLPSLPHPVDRDLGKFLGSVPGHEFFSHNWGWVALVALMAFLNTVIGEELLFRGFLLPRMQGRFGRADWLVNGLLFGLYHLHVPWAIPNALLDTLILAYPARRYRSALLSIAVHSAQSVVIMLAVISVAMRSG